MEKATEQKVSSFNDAGLWTKLLEKAKKGTTAEPYFVADVVEGCLHTAMFGKLGLPAVFHEHYHKKLSENIILEGPDGRKWPVMLGLSWESKPCLLNGWREFAADYNLVVNDKILFFLWEDSHFLVQVFDSNHNIKSKGGRTDSCHARNLQHEVEPIESSSIKMRPKKVAHPSDNNNEVVRNGDTEDRTTQAAPSSEKLGEQDHGVPGDEEDANEENMKKLLGDLPNPALLSEAEEEQVLRLKRSRKLNRKTEGREGDEHYNSGFDRLGNIFKLADYLKETGALRKSITAEGNSPATAEIPVTKANKGVKPAKHAGAEKKQQKRSQKLPTGGAKVGSGRKRQAKGMKRTLVDDQDAQPMPEEMVPGKSSCKVKVSKDKEKEPATNTAIEAASPVTPLSVEAVKPTFKRPKPRILPNPSPKLLYISKRRPVTTQEREAALESANDYARRSINKNFVMQMRTSQVYCGFHLAVPPEFVDAMGLPLASMKVILFDVTVKTWEVEWLGDHPKRPGLHSAGWTKFVLEHCLEEGDVCVFELPHANVFNIAVQIFTVIPLEPKSEHGWRSHYIPCCRCRTRGLAGPFTAAPGSLALALFQPSPAHHQHD